MTAARSAEPVFNHPLLPPEEAENHPTAYASWLGGGITELRRLLRQRIPTATAFIRRIYQLEAAVHEIGRRLDERDRQMHAGQADILLSRLLESYGVGRVAGRPEIHIVHGSDSSLCRRRIDFSVGNLSLIVPADLCARCAAEFARRIFTPKGTLARYGAFTDQKSPDDRERTSRDEHQHIPAPDLSHR